MHHGGQAAAGFTPASFKTGSLQQTENYIWNTADALGKGATAVVYFGRHKDSGDVCAVKVFHERIARHMFSTRQREIETLRSLRHENIVKLIALETETVTGNEVLVMEYCSGGSLYTMLEQPQYAYGFPETEFLLFLRHLADGMRYLRSAGYIHRDIKPGNIMRFIAEDGRSLYKITDFGAARELQEDETFMSIYGTEEYLYPKMYEQAVLRRPGVQEFDASVDLWSLGVTLYHVATGQLPFQPYGGRSNSATMHLITSKKPTGAISGVQKTLDGPIEWSNTLPDTCQMSDYLKQALVEMFTGLMELDSRKMWNFDMFFQMAHKLDNRLILHVFSCCTAQHIRLYVDTSDTYTKLQDRLAAETELPAIHQLILWHDQQLCDVIDQTAQIRNYPKSVIKTRWYLVNRQSMENYSIKLFTIPPFPHINPSMESLDVDAVSSKKSTAVAYLICTAVGTFLEQQKHISKGELLFRRFIKNTVGNSEWIVPEIKQRLEETRMHQESFSKTFNLLLKLFNTLNSVTPVEEMMSTKVGMSVTLQEPVNQLLQCLREESLDVFYEKIYTRLNEIEVYVSVLSKRISEQEIERLRHNHGCVEDDHCLSKAETLKNKIASVSATMVKHRKYGDLHSHEKFIHKCEKQKLQEYNMFMWSLAVEHCKKNVQNVYRSTQREMGNLTKHLTRTKKVEQNISSVKDSLLQLSDRLKQKEEKCRSIVEKITKLLEKTLVDCKGRFKMSPLAASDVRSQPPGAETTAQAKYEPIRSELSMQESVTSESDSSGREGSTKPKRQRTMLLDKLTKELMSLKTDSDELRQLVVESGDVMQQFLSETSNLRIEGSLDSDQRRLHPDDT
ncbi:serine/threonine-protein kinase TBK1-like isoform X3 [Ruditapes philippinarum]|nr:serine/threonine-protein kinase TBK1-like isoform X3 [Ruditapes philippinarum]XP_060598324.1 serine/threonine-protein kinase TBK1-like isoform X3 [Ruditapes philippinarum]